MWAQASPSFALLDVLGRHLHSVNPWALALGVACVAGLAVWPHVFKPGGLVRAAWPASAVLEGRPARMAARLPAPIVALVSLTLLSVWLQLPVETIGTRFGGIPAALPSFALPAFTWETAKQLLIPTVTIALLGAVESLLCARVADNLLEPAYPEMTRHDPNQELIAQAAANFVATSCRPSPKPCGARLHDRFCALPNTANRAAMASSRAGFALHLLRCIRRRGITAPVAHLSRKERAAPSSRS